MADQLTLPSDLDPPPSAPDTSGLTLPSDLDEQRAEAAKPSTAMDVAKSVPSGLAQGTTSTIGAPGSLMDWIGNNADYYMQRGLKASGLAPAGVEPQSYEDIVRENKSLRGETVLPRTDVLDEAVQKAAGPYYQPKTKAGQYAETMSEFVPGALMMGPEGVGKKLLYGAAIPGAASQGAGDLAKGYMPDSPGMEAAGRIGGALLGGVTGHIAEAGLRATGRALEPVTETGQKAIAARQFHDAAEDPEAAKAALGAPDDMPDGVKLTSFQKSGDRGLGVAEKKIETSGGMAAQPFIEQRGLNEKALTDSLAKIQPGGSVEDLASGLRNHLQALDDVESGKLAAATTAGQDAASAMGGHEGALFYGQKIQEGVQPQVDAARQGLSGALDAVGGTGTPEGYGSQMRAAEQAGKDAAKSRRTALYDAIDPDGKLNIVANGPRQAAADLVKNLSPMAAKPAGEEADILSQMQKMPDVVPFKDLRALDSRITAAMSQERRTAGETPVWKRLTDLKGSVMDAISNGVANQVAYERHGIATGQMLPSEADLENRLRAAWNVPDAVSARRTASGSSASDFGAPGVGSSAVARAGRADVSPGRGPREASGNSGVSPPPPEPNFDQAAADRLNVAKQTHAEYARAYKDGPTANRLKTNGFAGQYQLIDSGVPSTVFGPGPKGAELVNGFLKNSNNSPEAQNALHNYAAMTLRRAAERPDGTIDPKKYLGWLTGHQDALRAMPDLMKKFGNVKTAADALETFRPFTAENAPSAIPEMFFHSGPSGGEGVSNLRNVLGDRLTNSVLGDYAASKLRSAAMRADGTVDPAKVTQFLKTHGPAVDALPGLRDKFSTAAKATEAIADAAAARTSALDAYQKGVVGKVIGAEAPADIPRLIGGILGSKTAGSQMMDLARKAQAAGPDAVQGLRSAIADHIATSYISNTEAGLTGTNKISANSFQTFVRKNGPVLSHVFSPDEVSTLEKMSDAITKMNRSRDAVLVKGHSPTTQLRNMHGGEGAHGDSMFAKLAMVSVLARETAEGVANLPFIGHYLEKTFEKSVFPAAVAIAGVKSLVHSMRAAGLQKATDLFNKGMLDPATGRFLLEHYTPQNANRINVGLSERILRQAPFYGSQLAPAEPAQQRAAGGRVTGPDTPVTHITGEEIAPKDASTDELRKAARDYYERNLRGTKVYSNGLGRHVEFRGARKAFSASGNPDKLRMFAALKDLVGKAHHVESTAPKDPKAEEPTRAYHYLEAKVGTPDGHRRVGLTVREDTTGNLYYNHSMRDEEERPRPAATQDTASKAGPGSAGSGAATPNIDLDDGPIKRAAGGRVEPTDAQKEAGNYRKDHVRLAGMDISIENRKGEQRTGIGKNGKRWAVRMPAHYGYIRGTTGADGDHVDCYVGPHEAASHAYIVDQHDADTGKFDEHKVMLGFPSPEEAVGTYLRGFSDGKGYDRIGALTRIPTAGVLGWAKSGAATKPTRAAV